MRKIDSGSWGVYVEIVAFKDEEVVKRMGPMTERDADRVTTGAMINLNAEEYFVRTVPE